MRLAKIDNCKVLLTFLVVLGHVLVFMRVENFTYIMNVIYSFHMPAFIFINGFLFKDIQLKKYLKLFATFIIMQIFYLFYFKSIGYYNDISFENIFIPAFHLWYLLAFILWSILTKFINTIKNRSNLLFTLLITLILFASFFIRFTNFDIHDQFLTYTRIFVFFPYFISGYYSKNIILHFSENITIKILSTLLLALATGSILLLTSVGYLPKTLLFFGFSHFHSFNMGNLAFLLLEIFQFVIAFAFIFSIYSIIPTTQNSLTLISKNVTFIYLFHPIFASLLIKWNFNQYSISLNIMLSIFISLIIFYVLNLVSNFFNKKNL